MSILNNLMTNFSLGHCMLMMASNDLEMIVTTKGQLISNFDIKDMGDASYVLEVEIYWDQFKRVIGLSQKTYLKNI